MFNCYNIDGSSVIVTPTDLFIIQEPEVVAFLKDNTELFYTMASKGQADETEFDFFLSQVITNENVPKVMISSRLVCTK